MAATIEFFPVDNGDMTLITLANGQSILIDINIRVAADKESDETPDVGSMLRNKLNRDDKGRLYVDAFLLSHPDQDHCRGLSNHFHLGDPDKWKEGDDKIVIREMWSSPIVFRRRSELDGVLCEDAKDWWKDARRRVKLYRDRDDMHLIDDGNRIKILGEDSDGKTNDLESILVKTGEQITSICGKRSNFFSAWLLAPLASHDQDEETIASKNHSSVVLRWNISGCQSGEEFLFLSGGDAEVANWERIWEQYQAQPERLEYDLLQAPHHCSWHSLSFGSWSDKETVVSTQARSALGQAKYKARIVASSKSIQDDDKDPPCIGAKKEYVSILRNVNGTFLNTVDDGQGDVLTLTINDNGSGDFSSGGNRSNANFIENLNHPGMAQKRGGGRYA
jgi:hypothetical protein